MRLKHLIRLIVPSILLFIPYLSAWSQEPDYREIFGKDWKKAEEFVATNEYWMKPLLERQRIDYRITMAVIFPEIVRYSALRDMMEITLLKALYVNVGEEYANFSIGNFQIKPSFATLVCENEYSRILRRRGINIPDKKDFKTGRDFRSEIVKTLEDTRAEFNYIIVFMKICDHMFDMSQMTDREKVVLISTTYNYGFNHSLEEIQEMAGKHYFNIRLFSSENYSYSEIALCWYECSE